MSSKRTKRRTSEPASTGALKRAGAAGRDLPSTPEIIELDIASVVPYPHQQAIYGDLPEAALRTLRLSMESDGQRDPIEVLPPGNAAELPENTVVDGNQRIAAAKALGWATIDARVRWDLRGCDAEAIHRLFLKFNFERRQLSQFQAAMVVAELHASSKSIPVAQFDDGDWQDVRDRIADLLNLSPKNALRYVRILQAPPEVQIAVRDGRLNCLDMAARVAGLPEESKQEIAEKISSIDAPDEAKSLLESFLPKKNPSPFKELDRLAVALDRARTHLEPHLADLRHPSLPDHVEWLRPGVKLLQDLVRQFKTQ